MRSRNILAFTKWYWYLLHRNADSLNVESQDYSREPSIGSPGEQRKGKDTHAKR
jgi:hypothetical protein